MSYLLVNIAKALPIFYTGRSLGMRFLKIMPAKFTENIEEKGRKVLLADQDENIRAKCIPTVRNPS